MTEVSVDSHFSAGFRRKNIDSFHVLRIISVDMLNI